jgi:hypothetical protein
MDHPYAWIIDKDHIAVEVEPEGTNMNALGVIGPRDAPEDLILRLKHGEGRLFRMYDDDGELYYSGRILVEVPDSWALQDEHFGPLYDFGGPNAGCTEIRYKQGKSWVTL